MNDAIESISIGFTIAIVFAIPFGFAAFMRYLKYKETIALAERGLIRESRARKSRDPLRWGIIISFVGFGLTLALLFTGAGPGVVIGIVPLFFGLALIVIYKINKEEDREEAQRIDEDDDPIPPHKLS